MPETSTISNDEAVMMMRRCKDEIVGLRRRVDQLQSKADAYDSIAIILGLLPQPQQVMTEDIVWRIDQRIRELLTEKSEPRTQSEGTCPSTL